MKTGGLRLHNMGTDIGHRDVVLSLEFFFQNGINNKYKYKEWINESYSK